MKLPLHPVFVLLPTLLGPKAAALEIRVFNAAVHDRFTNFDTAPPVMNPGFLYDPLKFTGVGWNSTQAHKQFALVSPLHFLASKHNPPNVGHVIKFVAADGSVVQRNCTSVTVIQADDPGATDLALCTLGAPVPANVKPLPYLNLPDTSNYIGRDLMVFGHGVAAGTVLRAGHGEISDIDDLDPDVAGEVYGTNRLMEFIYSGTGTDPDDAYVTLGDSGSPTFAEENNQPALVGIHFYEQEEDGDHYNVDTFVPYYVPKLDLIMASTGYRVRPAIFTPTTLSFTPTYTPGTFFHVGEAASLGLALENTGVNLTGNFAVTLSFPGAQAPAAVTAAGCVVESVGSGVWSIRKATVAAGEDIAITASWTSVPELTQITGSAVVESDATTTATYPLSIPAAMTYAEWAQGLSEDEQADDPDKDRLENALEYAFGSDAESGFTNFPGGEANQPRMEFVGGTTVRFSYPERVNASLLGLSYQVEMTPGFAPGPWVMTLPVGASTTSQPFVPAVPGFVKRVITWPLDTPVKGARVRVTLAE